MRGIIRRPRGWRASRPHATASVRFRSWAWFSVSTARLTARIAQEKCKGACRFECEDNCFVDLGGGGALEPPAARAGDMVQDAVAAPADYDGASQTIERAGDGDGGLAAETRSMEGAVEACVGQCTGTCVPSCKEERREVGGDGGTGCLSSCTTDCYKMCKLDIEKRAIVAATESVVQPGRRGDRAAQVRGGGEERDEDDAERGAAGFRASELHGARFQSSLWQNAVAVAAALILVLAFFLARRLLTKGGEYGYRAVPLMPV